MVFSTAATNWAVGMLLGAGAKFKPLLNTDSWAGVRGLEDRFTTDFFLLAGACGRFFWVRRRRSSNLCKFDDLLRTISNVVMYLHHTPR